MTATNPLVTTEVTTWLGEWLVQRGALSAVPADFVDANIFDRQWVDSFGIIELIEETEKRFGITFVSTELDDGSFAVVSRFAELVGEATARRK